MFEDNENRVFNTPYNPFVLNTRHDPEIDARKAIIQTWDRPEVVAEREAKLKEKSDDEVGFIGGIKHSWFSDFITKNRARSFDKNETPSLFIPSEEEKEWAYKELGGDYELFENAWNWSVNSEDFKKMVAINKERQEYRRLQGNAGFLDNMASGFGEGLADPTNFLIPGVGGVRAISVATRIASGMAAGVSSELLNWTFSGEDPAILESALFGAAMGGAFEFATNKAFRADTKSALGVITDFGRKQAARTNSYLKTNKYTSPFWTNIVGKASKLDSELKFTVYGAVDKAGDTPIGQVMKQILVNERGYKDEVSKSGVHKQWARGVTVEDHIRDIRNHNLPHMDAVGNNIDTFLKLHKEVSIDDLAHEVNKAVSTGKARYSGIESFDNIVDSYKKFAKQNGDALINAGMIKGTNDPSTFYHRVWDSSKVDDFLENAKGTSIAEKKENAQEDLSRRLVEGVFGDANTEKQWRAKHDEEVVQPWQEAKKKVDEQNAKKEEKVAKDVERQKQRAIKQAQQTSRRHCLRRINSLKTNQTNVATRKGRRARDVLNKQYDKEWRAKEKVILDKINKMRQGRWSKWLAEDRLREAKGATPQDRQRIRNERKQIRKVKLAIYTDKRKDVWYGKLDKYTKEKLDPKYDTLFKEANEKIQKERKEANEAGIKRIQEDEAKKLQERLIKIEQQYAEKLQTRLAKMRRVKDPDMYDNFDTWLMDQARKDAFAIIDRNRSANTRPIDSHISNAFGNDYQKSRNPWNTWWEGKDGWSVDRLQRDTYSSMISYNTNTSVDLALNRVFGTTSWSEFQERVAGILKESEKHFTKRQDIEDIQKALTVVFDNFYGRTGLQAIENGTKGDAIYEILRNITYTTKNGMIGAMNFLETTEAIKAYGAGIVFKSMFRMMPKIGKEFDRVFKKGLNSHDFEYVNAHLFGQDQHVRGLWREIHSKNVSRYGNNSFLTKMVSGSEWVATNSPFSRFVNASQNSIVAECRGQFLADLIRTSKKKGGTSILSDKVARERMNMTPEQFNKVKSALNKSTSLSANGKITIKPEQWKQLVEGDTETRLLLRRMGDYVANEVIQRNHPIDLFMSESSRKSPWINSLLYFKTFAIRSWNKRLMKSVMRVSEGDIGGQIQTWIISGALGYLNFTLTTLAACAGLNDEQRRNYLKKVTGAEDFNEITPEVISNHFLNGALRMNLLAAPSLALNLFGINPSVKTTSDTDVTSKENPLFYADPAGFVTQNMPMYSVIKGGLDFGAQAWNQAFVIPNHPELSYNQREAAKKRFYRDARSITPNVPFLRDWLLNQAFDYDDKY